MGTYEDERDWHRSHMRRFIFIGSYLVRILQKSHFALMFSKILVWSPNFNNARDPRVKTQLGFITSLNAKIPLVLLIDNSMNKINDIET